MGVGMGGRGALAPWILKFSVKKVVFLVLSGKNQISPLLEKKFRKNILVAPLEKNPSDAHVGNFVSTKKLVLNSNWWNPFYQKRIYVFFIKKEYITVQFTNTAQKQ